MFITILCSVDDTRCRKSYLRLCGGWEMVVHPPLDVTHHLYQMKTDPSLLERLFGHLELAVYVYQCLSIYSLF
jgi:hypothetical protein